MFVSLPQLQQLLQNNVLELKFSRRIPKSGEPPTRRMLCTNNFNLLNSTPGRLTLNFRPAQKAPPFNPTVNNLVITWDVFMQDYRCVPAENCDVISIMEANDEFWTYYNNNLSSLSKGQKMGFMRV